MKTTQILQVERERNMFEKQKTGNNTISIISAFALGGLIGAAVALLMAPQSGEETRTMLRERGMEITDKAHDTAEETRRRAERTMDDLAERTKQRTEEIQQHGHEAIDRTRSNF
jgi:gas vesicle protein